MTLATLIKNLIQEKLGINYSVEIDGYSDVQTSATSVAVYLGRTPYPVDKDTEALTLRLEFYGNSTTLRDKKYHSDNLAALAEVINGVQYVLDDYTVVLYLQAAEPQSTQMDSGKYMTLYQMNGTGLSTKSGKLPATATKIEIKHSADSAYETVEFTSFSMDLAVNHISAVPALAAPEQRVKRKDKSRVYAISFLKNSSNYCKRISADIINSGADNLTDTYSLKVTEYGFTTTFDVALITAKQDGFVGAFSTIVATFRRV